MLDKLASVEAQYNYLMGLIADPAVQADAQAYRTHTKTLSDLQEMVDAYRSLKSLEEQLAQARELVARRRCGHGGAGPRGTRRPGATARQAARTRQVPADPEGPQRRQERRPRSARGHGRRGSRAVCRRAVPHVRAVRRAAGLEVRGDVHERRRCRRHEGRHRHDRGQAGLQPPEVRERRAPRAARAGDRGQRPHPHVDRDGGGAARGRGSRHPDPRQGPAHRHVLLERPRRPERQHHLFGGAHHAHPDRHGRVAAGREVADQEPREGDEGAALAALRDGDAQAAGRDRQGPQEPGGHRRALREDPHLQLPAEPDHRSPRQLHDAPARRPRWMATCTS